MFQQGAIDVGGSDDSLKCWDFVKGLKLNYASWEKLGRKEARNLKDLLSMVHPYINYEETLVANNGGRALGNAGPSRLSNKYLRWSKEGNECKPCLRFYGYKHLNTLREIILKEYANTNLKRPI